MRIVVAVEHWRSAHCGASGTAWWLVQGLRRRGHDVIVTPATSQVAVGSSRTDLLRANAYDEAIQTAEGTQATASRRVLVAPNRQLPGVQWDLLGKLGRRSDPFSVDLSGVDGVMGVGATSEHVRGILRRGSGIGPTTVYLVEADRPFLRVPVFRQFLRGHLLATHDRSLANMANTVLERPVITTRVGGLEPQSSNSSEAGSLDAGDGTLPERYGLWVRSSTGPFDRAVASSYRSAGIPVIVSDSLKSTEETRDMIRLEAPYLTRLESVITGATHVTCTGGDSGDLAYVAWRAGKPVVCDRATSLAPDIRASNGGWVLSNHRDVASVLRLASTNEGCRRGTNGLSWFLANRLWDSVAPDYEALIDQRNNISDDN